jgi:hypothetical protein
MSHTPLRLPPSREGRCLGGLGVPCPHAQPGTPPAGCHQLQAAPLTYSDAVESYLGARGAFTAGR